MNIRSVLASILMVCVAPFAVAAQPAVPDAVLVPAAKGADKTAITFDDKHVYLDAGAVHLFGQNQAGKRYWRKGQGGEALAEIVFEPKGFKVRDPAEKLLWKVTIEPDKIKIADNEEMQHPYTIKRHPEQDKLFDAKNAEIGAAKKNAETGKIKLKDSHDKELFVLESGKASPAYVAMLLKDIPETQRQILVAELFMRTQ